MIVIDGDTFNVRVIDIDDTPQPLDKYALRTADGVLRRELVGIFPKHKVLLGAPVNQAEREAFEALWDKLLEPIEFHEVTMPYKSFQQLTYTAYFSGIQRRLRKHYQDGRVYWSAGTFTSIGKEPMAVPE